MRLAAQLDDLIACPLGRYFADVRVLCWCRDERLFGCIYRGHVGRADAERIVRVLDAELHPALDGHASIADLRRLESVTAGAFDVLAGYLGSRREQLARSIGRQAILRPEGMLGSVVAGFYEVHRPPHPARTFVDAEEALAWLGRGHDRGLLAELDGLHGAVATTPELVHELRRLLRAQVPYPDLERAARELGLSTRTLQRRLGEAGTSFKVEVGRARVEAAQALLVETDASLTAIAHDVGCSSLQHMSVLFRRFSGRPPSAWRLRAEADRGD